MACRSACEIVFLPSSFFRSGRIGITQRLLCMCGGAFFCMFNSGLFSCQIIVAFLSSLATVTGPCDSLLLAFLQVWCIWCGVAWAVVYCLFIELPLPHHHIHICCPLVGEQAMEICGEPSIPIIANVPL